jgi:hypothetical protein
VVAKQELEGEFGVGGVVLGAPGGGGRAVARRVLGWPSRCRRARRTNGFLHGESCGTMMGRDKQSRTQRRHYGEPVVRLSPSIRYGKGRTRGRETELVSIACSTLNIRRRWVHVPHPFCPGGKAWKAERSTRTSLLTLTRPLQLNTTFRSRRWARCINVSRELIDNCRDGARVSKPHKKTLHFFPGMKQLLWVVDGKIVARVEAWGGGRRGYPRCVARLHPCEFL